MQNQLARTALSGGCFLLATVLVSVVVVPIAFIADVLHAIVDALCSGAMRLTAQARRFKVDP